MRYLTLKLSLIHVSAAFLVGICIFLSTWQWDRAHVPTQPSTTRTAISLETLSPLRDYLPVASVGRKVYARGHFVSGSNFTYDSRPIDGTELLHSDNQFPDTGWVVSIFQLEDSSELGVVLGAGQISSLLSRNDRTQTITGYLQPAEDSPNIGLPEHFEATRLPITLKNLRTLNHASGTLHDGYLVLTQAPKNLKTVRPIFTEPLRAAIHWRNVIYTFNWLFFAFIILAMWWRIVHDEIVSTDSAPNVADLSHG